MSRGFFGGMGGGGSNSGGGSGGGLFGGFNKKPGAKASDVMKKNMLKKGGVSSGADKYGKTDYNQMMNQRIEQYKNQMMMEARSTSGFNLPGTDASETRELSEGAKDVIRQMAEKKARREAKKQKIMEGIRPKQDAKKGPINFLSQTIGGVADNGRSGDGRGPLYNDER